MVESSMVETEKSARKLARAFPFLILVLGAAGFLILSGMRESPETRILERLPPVVTTVPVVACSEQLKLKAEGEVVPYREVTLSAEVPGRIFTKAEQCRAGHYVRQGELLIKIDSRDYELEMERIRQSVKQTEVNVEELDVEQANIRLLIELAESDKKLQQEALDRYRALFEQRATSQANLDNARRGQIQAENAVQTLVNQRTLLQTRRGRLLREKDRLLAELEKAILDRERTEIRAPISGVITEDLIEQDDYVQRGAPLVRLEDTSSVEVRFDLKLDELRWIWSEKNSGEMDAETAGGASYRLPSLAIAASVESLGQRYQWTGSLSRYDGARLNPATRTVPCVAVIDQPRKGELVSATPTPLPGPPALLSGMFVSIEIAIPTRIPLVEVPTVALRPGNRLWLLEDDRLVIRNVDVAMVESDRTLVLPGNPGLAIGEQVITSPLALAVDGMSLRQDESTASSPVDAISLGLPSVPDRSATKDVSAEVSR
jgi:multidrug efflux pump subunit AcrA (membrane-fusion protein)